MQTKLAESLYEIEHGELPVFQQMTPGCFEIIADISKLSILTERFRFRFFEKYDEY
ncbi:hypothetical protein PEC18_09925 [Paucibacter sp. O1-1]|nr:hypothetical protein [Paucibacter sp. O1-1]MDA3826165.1 hypothetical protein [Paucibacter sp. O1-1]